MSLLWAQKERRASLQSLGVFPWVCTFCHPALGPLHEGISLRALWDFTQL
jgi:hypothetical protein